MANHHSTSSLITCPFCGAAAELVRPVIGEGTPDAEGSFGDVFVAQCSGCLCQGPGGATAAEAVRGWNRRPGPARAA